MYKCVCVWRENKRERKKKRERGGGAITEKLSGRPTPARLPTSPPLHSASWDRPPNELLAPKSLFQALLWGEFKHPFPCLLPSLLLTLGEIYSCSSLMNLCPMMRNTKVDTEEHSSGNIKVVD